jgi:hypothetical protein
MSVSVGQHVWIPCEVKPGPFSDERMVRLHSKFSDWLGFVSTEYLRDPIPEGKTLINAIVVDIQDGRISAKLPGEAFSSTLYDELISRVQPSGPI